MSTGSPVSETGGRLSASMEENEDLPAYVECTLCCLVYHHPLWRFVIVQVVTVIPHHRMDDP